jgi:hypothetical protein
MIIVWISSLVCAFVFWQYSNIYRWNWIKKFKKALLVMQLKSARWKWTESIRSSMLNVSSRNLDRRSYWALKTPIRIHAETLQVCLFGWWYRFHKLLENFTKYHLWMNVHEIKILYLRNRIFKKCLDSLFYVIETMSSQRDACLHSVNLPENTSHVVWKRCLH